MDVICAGRALLLAEHPHSKPHLWFILTDPDGDPPCVVGVMLRTRTSFTDDTVVLEVGDHPFVRHASSVHYSTAQPFRVAAILAALRAGRCSLSADLSPDLLERVRRGLLDSPFTVHAVKDYCRSRFG